MIIHASKDFEKRFKCDVSMKGQTVLQAGRLDAWSAHCFKIGRKSAVFFMNDATLYSVLVPACGLFSFKAAMKVLLVRIGVIWRRHGASFDVSNQSIIVLPRTNKSLISSMSEAIRCVTCRHEYRYDCDPDVEWSEYEYSLNDMPYKALNYDSPEMRLSQLLKSTG